MPDKDLKIAIQDAIQQFEKKPLATAATDLLETLGYRSQKRLMFTSNTPGQFMEELDPHKRMNVDKALLSEWSSVDLLFQITDEEIQGAMAGQGQLFVNQKVDNTIINSYLFFAVGLRGEQYSRTQLAAITREINKPYLMPVMVIFKHGQTMTIAIIARRLHKRDPGRDVLEKVTLIKDVTINQPHRAHVEILYDLSVERLAHVHGFTNFVELQRAWEKTLDTSELNKKFFREVANWYFWAVNNVTFPEGAGADEETRNAISVIRLITRLIFAWFIKEKGLVPEDLFDERRLKELLNFSDPNQSTYYKAILQNLFFATLNTEMGENRKFRGENEKGRDQHYMVHNVYRYKRYFQDPVSALNVFAGIPFLNGGLFECLDRPDKDDPKKIGRVDGFSDRDNPLQVPDELFFGAERGIDLNDIYDTKNKKYKVRGLIHIFNSYKFTIEENTPIEEEIALDPELLGKVFENLLAAYNPETGTTARKQTGSFYTPREIVNYMVDESLIAYLERKLEGSEYVQEHLRHLLAYNDEKPQFNDSEIEYLIDAIDNIKVLDPACGSGAFPMGMLHKSVYILSKLDPFNTRWCELQLQKAIKETEEAYRIGDHEERRSRLLDIEAVFNDNTSDYGRKLFLIENCIYGVDIQPIAIQISKLRFFISLIVDQKVDRDKLNLGIRPLPNLETKFVAANTLIGIEKPQQMIFRNPLVDIKEKELAVVRARLFAARTLQTKRKLRAQDAALRAEIAELLKKDGWGGAAAALLAGWDPYNQNANANFFDPEWMFGIKGGFDVVVGNPPYLESRHPSFGDELKDKYQLATKQRWGNDATSITRGSDLLIYFFEQGISSINENGCVVLLTQNSWLDTEYGKKFQNFLLKNTQVKKIVDSDYRYFISGEGPNINTVITLFVGKKSQPNSAITFARYHENFQQMSSQSLMLTGSEEKDSVDVHRFNNGNSLLQNYKWGILLASPGEILYMLELLKQKAINIERIKLTFGQGLNLSKDYVIDESTLSKMSFAKKAVIPFLTSDDGAIFYVSQTHQYILDKSKLSKVEVQQLQSKGIYLFDPRSTTKTPPKLIMPRGISRHFCALNVINCYSSSFVDVYSLDENISYTVILNLWLFFNSSICWLLREISGRKNLGGGMLKAEAVDLDSFPVYMEFGKIKEIESILEKIKNRQALNTIQEIETEEHKSIDKIVFDHLGISNSHRKFIVSTLKEKIIGREKKATS